MGPGLGTAASLHSDSDLLGTVWDWDALGLEGRAGLD